MLGAVKYFEASLPAGALAGSIAATVVDAVVSPLLADEVGKGLGVLGDVGRDAVVADAVVGQIVRVAVVRLGRHGFDTGLLETDERAGGDVLGAPVIWIWVRPRSRLVCLQKRKKMYTPLVADGTVSGSMVYG